MPQTCLRLSSTFAGPRAPLCEHACGRGSAIARAAAPRRRAYALSPTRFRSKGSLEGGCPIFRTSGVFGQERCCCESRRSPPQLRRSVLALRPRPHSSPSLRPSCSLSCPRSTTHASSSLCPPYPLSHPPPPILPALSLRAFLMSRAGVLLTNEKIREVTGFFPPGWPCSKVARPAFGRQVWWSVFGRAAHVRACRAFWSRL